MPCEQMKEFEATRDRYATGCYVAIGLTSESLAIVERRTGQFRAAYVIEAHRQSCIRCRSEL